MSWLCEQMKKAHMKTGMPLEAIFQGVDGSDWEAMNNKFKELHKAVNLKKSGENKKAKKLWSLKKAKDKGTDFHDLGSVQKIQTRSQVKLGFWAIHMKSLTAVRHAGTWVRGLKKTNNSGSSSKTRRQKWRIMTVKIQAEFIVEAELD